MSTSHVRQANLDSILGLLDRTQAVLALQQCQPGNAALEDALLAIAEAALALAEAISQPEADPVALRHRLEDVYSCARAAYTSTRFAIVSANDRPTPPQRLVQLGVQHRLDD